MRFSGISISVVVIAALGFANIGEAKIGAGNDDDSFGKDRALKGSKPEYIEYSGSEIRDITMREGHGENYGIPGIEYLGLGYNIFEGNPHGSDDGPIDPGFRNRCVKLVQNQDTLTSSLVWLRPLGVATKPLRACEFSSTSSEISNSRQYKTELSREVKQKYSASLSGQAVVKGVPGQISTSFAFEKSKKFESFREGLVEQSEVSYEAKAICTNFHAQFEPYYNQTLSTALERGLASLPVPYDETDESHRSAYENFIEAFGTHIVSEVSIGAKHIFTSRISTEDVLDLTRDKVDIANSMSFDLQASIFGDATKAKDQLAAATAKGGSSDNSITVIVTNQAPASDDDGDGGGDLSGILGASGSFSTTQESSTSSFSESQEKIKSKIKSIEEVNVGGTPPADGNWKTWASGLVPKGMPVQWSLVPIWDFMTSEETDAFADAFVDIYGFDLTSPDDDDSLLDTMHFGVADGTGRPISSYSSSAGSDYRTLVVASSLPRAGDGDSLELIVIEGYEGVDEAIPVEKNPVFCDPGDFVCGFEVYYDDYKATALGADFVDEEGIAEMNMKCCQATDWSIQYARVVQDAADGDPDRGRPDRYSKFKWALVTCPTDGFVIGARGKEYTPSAAEARGGNQDDPMGLTGLQMVCSTDRDNIINIYDSNRGTVQGGDWREAVYADGGLFVRGVSVRYVDPDQADGAGADSKDDQGITGVTLHLSSLESSGADHAIFTRKIVAESPNGIPVVPFATIIRGNVAPHAVEDAEAGLTEGIESGEFLPFSFYRPRDDVTNPTVAIMDFQDSILSASSLDAFSFLALRNPPNNLNVIAGVVHPQGYPVNDIFGSTLGFDIEMNNNNDFVIQFAAGAFGGDMPTMLTQPAWFSSISYPRDFSDLKVTPAVGSDCTHVSCLVTVGDVDEEGLEKSLGFSFLAIAGSGTTSGLIHGRIQMDASSILGFEGTGFTVTDDRTGSGTAGGFIIEFDTPFDSIPAVIATPLAVVEHVNRKKAYIKTGYGGDFYDLHFLVAAPPPSSL
mmetsp:Transcript_13680/g.39224  ORF Transcript_13680/g.39224 Transcript_13680/m.39224 type:complete len:1023 (-) Transcript_13680:163-3231(-)